MYFKILFLLVQNVIISATQESKTSTPRSRSLTPKSRRIRELEEKTARLKEEEKARLAEANARAEEANARAARLEEAKIRAEEQSKKQLKEAKEKETLLRSCMEKIAESDKSLSELNCLRTKGECVLLILQREVKQLESSKGNVKKICIAGGVVGALVTVAGIGALAYVAATGTSIVLYNAPLVVLGVTVASVGVTFGATAGGVCVILGLFASYSSYGAFSNYLNKIQMTKSQEKDLQKMNEDVHKCAATVEENKNIMKNLLNQKEINSNDCKAALASLSEACDKFDRAMSSLDNHVKKICKNSGDC